MRGPPDLAVALAEEVVPEALHDGGPHTQDLGDALAPQHHVPVVELHVHVRLLVHQVVGPARRGQANQLKEVTQQLVAAGRLGEHRQSFMCYWSATAYRRGSSCRCGGLPSCISKVRSGHRGNRTPLAGEMLTCLPSGTGVTVP